MSSELKFWDLIDSYILNPPIKRLRPSVGHYPSDASVEVTDANGEQKVYGSCLRNLWYKKKGYTPDTTNDASNLWKMDLGNATHELIVEKCKKAGFYIGDEVEFWDATNKISGRVDLIIKHPLSKRVIGIEIKSISGYHNVSKIIKPAYGKKPRPKTEHILQAAIYLDFFSKNQNIHEWQVVYISREEGERNHFSVNFSDTGEILVDGDKTGLKPSMIYDRFKKLEEYLKSDSPPERDYEIQYSLPRLLQMASNNELTDKQAEQVRKGKLIEKGDGYCAFCPYSKTCWENSSES